MAHGELEFDGTLEIVEVENLLPKQTHLSIVLLHCPLVLMQIHLMTHVRARKVRLSVS